MTEWGRALGLGCAIALAPFLLVGCGSSSAGGVSRTPPNGSTETGNPPVIDITRVALVVMRDEVHVTGEDGAVTPGGAELEIETLSSGDVARGKSDAKGAFDIQVAGTIDDTYELRALGESADVKSEPVYLSRGGASVGEGDGGTLACSQLGSLIEDPITQAADVADRACSSNADCTIVHAQNDCPVWPCLGPALSQAGASEIASSFGALQGMCQAFTDASCPRAIADCGRSGPAACVDSRCVDCALDDCSSASCDPCDTPEITWAPTGPMIGDAHTIVGCKTLLTIFAADSPQCTTELPCTVQTGNVAPLPGPAPPSPPTRTMAGIQNLLGDPSVKAAFESDKFFGLLTPAGFGTRLTIGDHSIFLSSATCGTQECIDAPSPVQMLFAALDRIAMDQSCPSSPTRSAACDLPFDAGTGSETVTVYAFDGAIGNCVPQGYSGAGGNANRFDTFASCQAACPPTAAADTCASDRVFVANDCLECLPLGCTPGDACMLRCADSTDCTDPAEPVCSGGGTCGSGGCP